MKSSFHTTRWTRVGLAKSDSEEGRRALADLCDIYYEPVIAFLRCRSESTDGARETAHEFFAQLLRRGGIDGAEPGRGKFRSYLLGAVKHFLSHKWEASRAARRGGGMEPVSMEATEVGEISDRRQTSPDAAFDRVWALTVLSRGMTALQDELTAAGKAEFYECIKPFLMGEAEHGDQCAAAEKAGMNVSAFRTAVVRVRKRLRELVKEEIAGTLDDAGMIQEEMESLLAALAE
jgi:RNA polymerase sigma-70 factor (ECF subfamily)